MGDFAFCSTFTEDYQLFRKKLETGTLTKEELIEFDKKYGCKLEYTYYADKTPEYLGFLFKPKKNIYSNPIIKRK
jgi:hypothetical protein|nr:MAG TPA: hypothetical protein [Caudoviricetes sp.]